MTREKKNATKKNTTQRRDLKSPAGRPAPESSGTGTAIGAALCLIIPGALLVWLVVVGIDVTVRELGDVLGPEGTPGTATVLSCEQTGSGKNRRYDCEADFVFDDRSKEPIVIDTVPDVEVGEVFPAVLTPEGDRVVPAGARGAWRVILPFSAIPFTFALVAFLTALLTRSKKAIIWTGAVLVPFTVVMVMGIVIGT
ncbi:hypothetical protein GCM10010156_20050 [Planobispora rosea]|uniref:Uncharacterized protein n=1 Tax=Planobispora rosea TaxID=35762 RepID=A0A8J3WE13_PLARO|nr:hypothetical protein [Planobispora rosea]GGS61444.1 hypothetical protein GCM10010156_20050 [Planobispora rosea]GIH86509.1 hypothetical protein Pro02_49170 [Planobispora rosea]